MTEPVTSTTALKPRLSKSRNYGKNDVFDGEYKLFQKILAEFNWNNSICIWSLCKWGFLCRLSCS